MQGHLHPDVLQKVSSGTCHPNYEPAVEVPPLAVDSLKEVAALCLGDIKGAFLEAGPLKQQFRQLFASQPARGIPGMHRDDVMEVVGYVYSLRTRHLVGAKPSTGKHVPVGLRDLSFTTASTSSVIQKTIR